jgi:UDP-N-acetyl-D-glucosamine dehydrogenase
MIAKDELIGSIQYRRACIGVVGLGYVGLPLAVAFAQAGFAVIGVDVDPQKVAAIGRAESYISDVPDVQLVPLVASGQLRASTDYSALAAASCISICVPTPLTKTRDPDITYIVQAAEQIERVGAAGKLIVLESTTYPGTTDEVLLPRLASNGGKVGQDFFLAFSPERIDPGRTDYTISSTPKVIGGVTTNCLDVARALYDTIVDHLVPVSSTAAAEMVKLLENTFRAVNIGLVNEVALMCDKLDLNVWEIVAAAATKPYGYMPFYPGPGLGGHCIPIDPLYLSWKLRTLNYTARFIDLAAEVNSHMPDYVVGKISDALNEAGKAMKGSKLLILGVAYKANVGDVRESPAIDIIQLLCAKGALVQYHDPYVATLTQAGLLLTSVPWCERALAEADCVVIVTDHAWYDWTCVGQQAKLIVDTRNALKGQLGCCVVTL